MIGGNVTVDVGWRADANCRGLGTGWSFVPDLPGATKAQVSQIATAIYDHCRPICVACTVRVECLLDGWTTGDATFEAGLRGGFTPVERMKIRRSALKQGVPLYVAAQQAVAADIRQRRERDRDRAEALAVRQAAETAEAAA